MRFSDGSARSGLSDFREAMSAGVKNRWAALRFRRVFALARLLSVVTSF